MLHITYNYALQTLCGAPHNVCNDDGIALGLPLNRMLGDYDVIHGTFFICGLSHEDFADLTSQQIKHYEELYHDPQVFFMIGNTLCVDHVTPEEYDAMMEKTLDKFDPKNNQTKEKKDHENCI